MGLGVLFIDDGHLEHNRGKKRWNLPRPIDYARLEAWCFRQAGVTKGSVLSHYYNAIPTRGDQERIRKRMNFFRALKSRGFLVQTRTTVGRRCANCGAEWTTQKGIDTLLAIDFVECAWKQPEITTYLIITADADMIPPIERVRTMGREVVLLHCTEERPGMFVHLRASADRVIEIRETDLRGLLMP